MTYKTIDSSPLYWQGNNAKTRIIEDLLQQVDGREVVVFDYGCGSGGDWPRILSDNPHLKLIGYEPHNLSYARALNRLAGTNAEIYTGNAAKMNFKADFIVSFSVLEHVFDRRAFLTNAHRLLSSEGVFYLNYDDGHFRNVIDLAEPNAWGGPIRVWLHNLLSLSLARIGNISRFQQRVDSDVINQMINDSGFVVERQEYQNLLAFKELFKTIDVAEKPCFSRFWMNVEEELNKRFLCELDAPVKSDRANLWTQMVSRTLWLRHG